MSAGHRRSNCCLGIALLILLQSFLLPVVQPDLANAGGHSVFMVHHHTMMPQRVLNGAANAAAAMQQKQQQMSAAQREILGRIHQNAMAMGGMGGGSSSTAWLGGGGNAGGQQQPPVPVNRKQEAEALARMQRIHALGTQLNKGQVLPGQLLAQQGKLFYDGKALPNQVADHAQKQPHHHHQHHQQHHHHQHKKHGGHGTQALAKAIVKAVDKKEKELLKPVLKQLHNKHSKGIRKANKAQRGFMAIVMHTIMRPSAGEAMLRRQQPKVLQESKDVHNLLWTAVALARERLSTEKTNAPVCLLEFLAHMVGGAFAPFKLKKHRDDTKLVHAFLHQLRHYQVAFLSSGYHHFWTKGPHKINNFVMMEKSAKPIFLNHE